MKNNHVKDKLTDFLDGHLDAAESQEIASHIEKCADCSEELEQLKKLVNAFKTEQKAVPSERLRFNFYQMLEEEKAGGKVVAINQKRNLMSVFLKIAAGIALLIGAFALGRFQQQQQSDALIAKLENSSLAIKETAMLSLMENQSASRRIQGVNFIEEFAEPDEAIIKALATRMLFDVNTNVRLSAVEALGKFTNSDTVKEAFINALEAEKDPSIQITIIHTLVAIQEKKAIEPMQRLLEQEETQPFVKQQIKSLLPSII